MQGIHCVTIVVIMTLSLTHLWESVVDEGRPPLNAKHTGINNDRYTNVDESADRGVGATICI